MGGKRKGERESVHINYAQYQVKVALVKLTLTVLSFSALLGSAQGLPLPPPSSPPHQKQRTKPVSGQAEVTLLTFMIACCVALAADWLPVGWGQMKMENSNGNANDEWKRTGMGKGI